MADSKRSIEELKAETDRLAAETALLNAQTALLNATKARDAAAQPTKLDELKQAKSVAEAERDLATAETDAAIAKTVGNVKGVSYTGAVELKEKSGLLEAQLLANKAIAEAAARVARDIRAVSPVPVTVVVVPGKSFKSFGLLATFAFRKDLAESALRAALGEDAAQQRPGPEGVAPLPVAAAGLDALGKLLSFFKSDYTLSGLDVSVDEAVAVYAVAGALRSTELTDEKGKVPATIENVVVPTAYLPATQQAAVRALSDQLRELQELRLRAEQQLEGAEGSEKERLKLAIGVHDSLMSWLATPEGQSGAVPIIALANEQAVLAATEKLGASGSALGYVLFVRLETTGGGFLIKKNLWTGLGGPPLYHMGGAALSYLLVEGKESRVIKGGTVAVHGGYARSAKVADELGKDGGR